MHWRPANRRTDAFICDARDAGARRRGYPRVCYNILVATDNQSNNTSPSIRVGSLESHQTDTPHHSFGQGTTSGTSLGKDSARSPRPAPIAYVLELNTFSSRWRLPCWSCPSSWLLEIWIGIGLEILAVFGLWISIVSISNVSNYFLDLMDKIPKTVIARRNTVISDTRLHIWPSVAKEELKLSSSHSWRHFELNSSAFQLKSTALDSTNLDFYIIDKLKFPLRLFMTRLIGSVTTSWDQPCNETTKSLNHQSMTFLLESCHVALVSESWSIIQLWTIPRWQQAWWLLWCGMFQLHVQ